VSDSAGTYSLKLVHSSAVKVARYGTGNSTSAVIAITETADEQVATTPRVTISSILCGMASRNNLRA